MAQRIRRVNSQKEFEQLIDDFITTGYSIKNRGEDNALVVKKGKHDKHLLVAILTFWWTLGIGNLIYALCPTRPVDEVFVKIEKP